jgi:hypothetical protein
MATAIRQCYGVYPSNLAKNQPLGKLLVKDAKIDHIDPIPTNIDEILAEN